MRGVADEVRNLAMRAADAAKNTANLIEGTVKKIKNGSDAVAKTNEAFSKVASGAKKVSELVGEIAAVSDEQASGLSRLKAVAEMDKVVPGSSSMTGAIQTTCSEVDGILNKSILSPFFKSCSLRHGKDDQKILIKRPLWAKGGSKRWRSANAFCPPTAEWTKFFRYLSLQKHFNELWH